MARWMRSAVSAAGLSALAPEAFAQAPAAAAQVQATVSGVVIDEAGGQPLTGAGVAVLNAAGAPVTGAVADAAGRFTIPALPPGQYTVRASHQGYAPHAEPLLVGARNTAYDLGRLRLARASEGAAEVEALVVTAQGAPPAEAGVSVFSMDQNVARAGGTVLEALRALPGVTIGEDGQINLRGSDRVPVLVDGKPSALTGFGAASGLDSIPASNIERIEIIANPSARYDAAGMAGIVNIVYRQDKKLGLHGDLGAAAMVGALSRRKEDIPSALGSWDFNPRYGLSANLAYNTERQRYAFQGEAITRRDLPNNEYHTRTYDDGRVRYSQIPENRKQSRYIAKGSADWTLGASDSLNLSSIFDREHHNDFADIPFLDENLQRTRLWFWKEDEVTGLFSTSLAWRHRFATPGHQVSVSVQYTRGWEDEQYFLNEVSPVRVGTDNTHIIATEHTFPIQVDYVRPLASGRIEAGAKLQIRRIPVTYDVIRGVQSVIYPGLGDESDWSEDTYAAYANWVHERPGFAVEAGLRAEQTKVSYELDAENIYYPGSDRYDYFRLFANARFTLNVGPDTRLSAFYNNRVDRPGEPELRIFPKYDDPENLKVGNPYLRPQFTETFELRGQQVWKGLDLSLSVFRRNITDPFTRVYAIDPTVTRYEVVNKIFHNTGKARQTGVELLASRRITPGWNVSASLNAYRNHLSAYDVDVFFPVFRTIPLEASSDTTWDAKLNSQLRLPWGLQLQAQAQYYAARNIAQGRRSARSSIDLGLTKKLYENRVELALTATDIFNRFGVEERIDGVGFTSLYQNFYQTQTVAAALKYSF